MNLPNLFLADLGGGLSLNPGTVREACQAIRRNRDAWLGAQRVRALIEMIAYTAEQWRDPDNGLRAVALARGPSELSVGPATLARGLDAFFAGLTVENLEGLVVQDLGDIRKLDDFAAVAPELRTSRSSRARGPSLLVHVAAGNLPNPTLMSMVLGLLSKSAQFVKCATGASLLPRLFAHSLAQTEPKLGASLELAEWPGGQADLEEALFGEAECVTATGSDATLRSIRDRLPLRCRFVGHGHRLSFGFVSGEMLSTYSVRRVVRDAVADIVAWNQLGCLSPHVFYVQDDGVVNPEGFAEALADGLAEHEAVDPRGTIPDEEAAAIAARRAVYELRAAVKPGTVDRLRYDTAFRDRPSGVRLWQSPESTAWTVVFDNDPRFECSCLNRFIYVKPVRDLAEVLVQAEPVRHQVSTVALAAVDDRAMEMARRLSDWGVPRVCPVGRMQAPTPLWRHDGRPALGDLVSWTDFET